MNRMISLVLVLCLLPVFAGCAAVRKGVDTILDSQEKIEEFVLDMVDKGAEKLKEEVPSLLEKGLDSIKKLTDEGNADEEAEEDSESTEAGRISSPAPALEEESDTPEDQ